LHIRQMRFNVKSTGVTQTSSIATTLAQRKLKCSMTYHWLLEEKKKKLCLLDAFFYFHLSSLVNPKDLVKNQRATSALLFASVSKRVFVPNHSYENVFPLQVHFHADQTRLFHHVKGFTRGNVLKQKHKVTRK